MNAKTLTVSLTATLVLSTASLSADTLLHWRIGTDNTVTNLANPGTMDGTFRSITKYGSTSNLAYDSKVFPLREEGFGAEVIDPVMDEMIQGFATVGKWTETEGGHTNSCLFLPKDELSSIESCKAFTIEAFVYVPESEVPLTGGSRMLTIVQHGRDDGKYAGYHFGLYRYNDKLQPFFRCQPVKKSDGKKGDQVQVQMVGPDIDRDRWHHVAATVDENGMVRLWLDYFLVTSKQISDYDGMYFTTQAFPFSVGADIYRGHWGFLGKLGDFRVSNRALTNLEFLRPVPPGPVDEDTLICLASRFSDFGQTNFAAHTWPYQYLFNSARTAEFSPRWSPRTTGIVTHQYPTSDVPGPKFRGGLYATNVFDHGESLHMSTRIWDSEAKHTWQSVIYVPDPEKDGAILPSGETNYPGTCSIPSDSFTAEWFFKTDGQVPNVHNDDEDTFTMLEGPWCKVCLYRKDGKLLTRLHRPGAMESLGDQKTSSRFDDSQWHHYALVYRLNRCAEVWVDRVKVNELATPNGINTLSYYDKRYLNFGGKTTAGQGFQGCLDGLRVTKRALSPDEFLQTVTTPAATDPNVLVRTRMDDDLSVEPAAIGLTAQALEKTGGSAAPSLSHVGRKGKYFEGDVGVDNRGYVKMNGGVLSWLNAVALQRPSYTIECFARIRDVGSANFLRVANKSTTTHDGLCWSLYMNSAHGLAFSATLSTNGVSSGLLKSRENVAYLPDSVEDGRWHHYAIAVSQKVKNGKPISVVKMYFDYDLVNEHDLKGTIYYPTEGTSLGIGDSLSGNFDADVDMLRVSAGDIGPDDFIRYRNDQGLILVVH